MKREILFRGKRIDNGEWVEGYYWKDHNGKHSITYLGDDNFFNAEVIFETVGQLTGLTDKNGVKIFEGDIIDTWSQGSHLKNGIIKYGIGRAGFFIGNKVNSVVWNLSGGGKNYIEETVEVIGNIHDNPELI